MVDYALMNQFLYEGNAKEVEQMTKDALAEGRSVQEVMNDGLIAGMSVMAEGAGFEVHDIGVDQSVEKFLAAAAKYHPTIVGMSALLTTTMTYMKTVIAGFEAAGLGDIKMAVGGAPISQKFADEIGADGYGMNASAAVDLFLRLAAERRATSHGDVQDPLLAGDSFAD